MSDANKIVLKYTEARKIIVKAGPIVINGVTDWSHISGKPTEFPPSPHEHAVSKIADYSPAVSYTFGDTVYFEGHLWRALKSGYLLPPTKEQGTAIVYINHAGFSLNPYRITSVLPGPPAGMPHTPFDMHLEYHSDINFKIYKPFGPTWQEITGVNFHVWRAEGVPSIPKINNGKLWIYSAPNTTPMPVAGQNDWTSIKFNTFLSELSDVDMIGLPLPGQALVYNSNDHAWVAGRPAWSIPDWDAGKTYENGDTVYYQGQFWRNINTAGGNMGHEPKLTPNEALGWYRHAGKTTGPIYAELVEVGDPAVAPTVPGSHILKYALKYQSDTSWNVWQWNVVSTHPTVIGWKLVPVTNKVTHRHFAEPSPIATDDAALLWIYAAPGTTSNPVAPETWWEPVVLGDFLVSLADVSAEGVKAGDVLVYGAGGKWTPQAMAGGNYVPIVSNGTANVTLDTPATTTSLTGSVVGYNGFRWMDATGVQQSIMGLTGNSNATATTPTMRYARNASGFTSLACITTGGLGSVSITALRKNQGTETNVSGGCITVSGTSGVTIDGSANNMTEKTSLAINSTGLKVTTTGNATTWTDTSLITRLYADTRYMVKSGANDQILSVSGGGLAMIEWMGDNTAKTSLSINSGGAAIVARNAGGTQHCQLQISNSGVTLAQYVGNPTWTDQSLITRSYADTRYAAKPATVFTGTFQTADNKTVTVDRGVIVSVT